jgi:hypothetical protein
MTTTPSDSNTRQTIAGYWQRLTNTQRSLLIIYVIGFVLMLMFNLRCYPGTYIGDVGWALIWPVSIVGYVIEYVLQLEQAVFQPECPAFIIENALGVLE